MFTNAPCKTPCLYNAPKLHTVDKCKNNDAERLLPEKKRVMVTAIKNQKKFGA